MGAVYNRDLRAYELRQAARSRLKAAPTGPIWRFSSLIPRKVRIAAGHRDPLHSHATVAAEKKG